MKDEIWFRLLRREVKKHSQAAVAKKTGLCKGTISQVINGKYKASTKNVEKLILRHYGRGKNVTCPVLDEIGIELCLKHYENSLKVGMRCGNPATMRLYNNCRKCQLLNGDV